MQSKGRCVNEQNQRSRGHLRDSQRCDFGIAVAVLTIALLDETGSGDGQAAAFPILSFIGTSGTTIGVGVLVILIGRVLAALERG